MGILAPPDDAKHIFSLAALLATRVLHFPANTSWPSGPPKFKQLFLGEWACSTLLWMPRSDGNRVLINYVRAVPTNQRITFSLQGAGADPLAFGRDSTAFVNFLGTGRP
jgi:hypothetical protein